MTQPKPPGPRVWKLFGSGLSGTWQVRQGPQVGDDDIYVDVVEEAELREAKAEVERLKAQDLTYAVIAADVKLREERDALASKLEVAEEQNELLREALYELLSNVTMPEKYVKCVRQALAEIGEEI